MQSATVQQVNQIAASLYNNMRPIEESLINVVQTKLRTQCKSNLVTNMALLGKQAYIIARTGQSVNVQPYSPNYEEQNIPIEDSVFLYECPFNEEMVVLVVRDAVHVSEMVINLIQPLF